MAIAIPTLNVLQLEPDGEDGARTRELLAGWPSGVEVVHVPDHEHMRAWAANRRFDIVLLTPEAAGRRCVAAVTEARAILGGSTPIIVLSAYDREDLAARCIKAGASAYKVKQHTGSAELLAAIRHAVAVVRVGAAARASDLARDLPGASERGELVIRYLPVVDVETGATVSVEALLRWQHPQHGLVPPAELMTTADELGLVDPICAWTLQHACAQLAQWDIEGIAPPCLAVNLSARQFWSDTLHATVAAALARNGLAPERLELELSEQIFADPRGAASVLGRLAPMGVRLVIDDFGAVLPSLDYRVRVRVHSIKVDRTFTVGVFEYPDAAAHAVSTLVAMARRLGLNVVGKGVETPDELALLRAAGFDGAQGFLFGRPLTADGCAGWLSRRRAAVARQFANS